MYIFFIPALFSVIVRDAWDPLSTRQTKLLTYLFQRLVDDYPSVKKESKQIQVFTFVPIFLFCMKFLVW